MAEIINMPRLSDTMEEGVVAKWLVKKGDTVQEGDILAEIETDKATMEFESFNSGTLLYVGIEEGETAPVDALLCIIGDKDEDISKLLNGTTTDTTPVETVSSEPETPSQNSTQLPEGVEIITMPRLSDTMEEGTVASWLKQEGDTVQEGDILAEIETDKATMEFESFYSGTLLKIGIAEGETAKVDKLLAIIGPKGTDVSSISENTTSAVSESKPAIKAAQQDALTQDTSKPQAATNGKRIFVSPLAKKMAEDKGIDLSTIQGSGDQGRIVKKDIENYKASSAVSSSTSVTNTQISSIAGQESFEEIKNSQMRKTIAKRLGESKFSAPHYYLTIEINMEHAMASRAQINAMPDVKVSYNDMVIKAASMALRKHPKVNSQWTNETTKIANYIHMGVAVAVDDGLLVPVLKFADHMSLTQIGGNVRTLAGKARDKKLTPDEMQGSTFTVSNLGMFGITEFTSIINQPNSAILSIGAIVEKPVVKDGNIVVGHTMKVTLANDHRTVDGATGAQFLQTFKTYMENPVTMLA